MHMTITYSILGLTAGTALLLASGCSKPEQPSGESPEVTPPAASDMQKASEAPKPATEPVPAAPAAATDASRAATAAASQANATVAATAAPSASSSQVEGLIYNAKGLVKNQKYQDALNVVQQLSSLKLTPKQQTLVDGLKAQIQTALAKQAAAGAASSLGGTLGGKK